MNASGEETLARRLGCTVHVSVLRMKLERLAREYNGETLEDWLVDVANARGARVVTRPGTGAISSLAESTLRNEELVIGILLPQNRDRPQMLRLAAQLISRGALDFQTLRRLAVQERCERVLAALAREALRVAPEHRLWNDIGQTFANQKRLRSPLLHFTRLAEPIPFAGRVNAERWQLVK